MTLPASDWLFVAFVHVGELHLKEPYALGAFEFTRQAEWDPGLRAALDESVGAFGLERGRAYMTCRTFLEETNEDDARRTGMLYAREAAEMLTLTIMAGPRPTVSGAGALLDLRFGRAVPLLPPLVDQKRLSFPVFQIDEQVSRDKLVIDRVLATNLAGELGGRIRQSSQWHRLGVEADELAQKLLFLWIAAEAIAKISESDNLTARFLAALSMPRGDYFMALDDQTRADLQAHATELDPWRKNLARLFDDGRELRNLIAHAGGREIEIRQRMSDTDIAVLVRALEMAVPRLQRLAMTAVALSIRDGAAMWASYGHVVRDMRAGIPLVDDAVGTVLFSLNKL